MPPRADCELCGSLCGFHRERNQARTRRYAVQSLVDGGVEKFAATNRAARFGDRNFAIIQF
jgi:hypothetical protein